MEDVQSYRDQHVRGSWGLGCLVVMTSAGTVGTVRLAPEFSRQIAAARLWGWEGVGVGPLASGVGQKRHVGRNTLTRKICLTREEIFLDFRLCDLLVWNLSETQSR